MLKRVRVCLSTHVLSSVRAPPGLLSLACLVQVISDLHIYHKCTRTRRQMCTVWAS